MTMTLSLAKIKGFATPSKASTGRWYATCWTCRDADGALWFGEPREYMGPAAADARTHNKEQHDAR